MVLICLFDLWGELGPGVFICEATPLPPPPKKNIGGAFTTVDPTLMASDMDNCCALTEQKQFLCMEHL